MASRPDQALGSAAVMCRFTLLHALRWLPTASAAPVLDLLPHQRGLGLAEIGAAFALYNAVVILLELPTGGWADRWGARPVLVGSAASHALGLGVLLSAHDPLLLAGAAVALGIARALGSGPLEAWAVTSLRRLGADGQVELLLSRATAVETAALAVGALAVAFLSVGDLAGVPALAAPVAIATVAALVHLGAVATLLGNGTGTCLSPNEGAAAVRSIVRNIRQLPRCGAFWLSWLSTPFALVAIEMLWQPQVPAALRRGPTDTFGQDGGG
jgi:MFS family permease